MLNSPIYKIRTPNEHLNVLQITDLHISTYQTLTNTVSTSISSCQHGFVAVLQQALNQNNDCDLILVTGDLVNKVEPAIYDYIYRVLEATGIPFACIAGNHDVTDEIGQELPFAQRKLVARSADPRLLSRQVIDTTHWQLLLINSAVPGKISGMISTDDIDWLCVQLSRCKKPTLLALHHHVIPMQSDWIDTHIAENTEIFWQRMAIFDHLRVIINGHTHQEQTQHCNGVTVYTTPSTCYQYKPFADNFAYDENARPGYRWLQLANNGQVASWVERLDTGAPILPA